MTEIEDLMSDTVNQLKVNAELYTERLESLKEKLSKLKTKDEADEKPTEDTEDKKCTCKIFMDLLQEQHRQQEVEELHHELLQVNEDAVKSLQMEAAKYRCRYDDITEEQAKLLQEEMTSRKKILRCPNISFDTKTAHKDVTCSAEGYLQNCHPKEKISPKGRNLTKVTGVVTNRSFSKSQVAYFELKADVQIVRNKHIEKARLYDIFDVYIGTDDVIDQLREPGVLYQHNMFGINVWYSNMRERVLVDILNSSRHLDRYAMPKKVKHGGQFQVHLGFLLDMPRATIHVLDVRRKELIGSAPNLNTEYPLWPAVQVHHCYHEPQYFDTRVSFVPVLDEMKGDNQLRKFLKSVMK